MRLRAFTGEVVIPNGGTVEYGQIKAIPRDLMPSEGSTAMVPEPAIYGIVNGELSAGQSIYGGTNYDFEVYVGTSRNPWRFSAGVPDVEGDPALTFGALVAMRGTFTLSAGFVEDMPTEETDTTLVLSPDGEGGVEWTEPTIGGTVADGSITTAKLAANAVTAAKVAADVATQAELDAEAATRAAADTANATAITNEATARAAADAALDTRVDALEAGGGGLTTEQVQDIVGAMVLAGDTVTISYDDVTGELRISANAEPVVFPDNYGAVGDGVEVNDAAMTNGSPTLTCLTSAPFLESHEGMTVTVRGAGTAGGYLTTTILSVTDAEHATLAANAATTVSGETAVWGTANNAAFAAALAPVANENGVIIYIRGNKRYLFDATPWYLDKDNVTIRGIGQSYGEEQPGDGHTSRGSTLGCLVPDMTLLHVKATDTNRVVCVRLANFALRGLGKDDGCTGLKCTKPEGSPYFSTNALWLEYVTAVRFETGYDIEDADAVKFINCSANLCHNAGKITRGVFASWEGGFIGDNSGVGITCTNVLGFASSETTQFIRNGGGDIQLEGVRHWKIRGQFYVDQGNVAEFTCTHSVKIIEAAGATTYTGTAPKGGTIDGEWTALDGDNTYTDATIILEGVQLARVGGVFGLSPECIRATDCSNVLITGGVFDPDADHHITVNGGTNVVIGTDNLLDEAKVATGAGGGTVIFELDTTAADTTDIDAITPTTGTWTEVSGNATITSNIAIATAVPFVRTVDAGTPNHRVTLPFNLGSVVEGAGAGVYLRYQDSTHKFLVYVFRADAGGGTFETRVQLYKYDGGAPTTVGAAIAVSGSGSGTLAEDADRVLVAYVNADDTFGIDCDGTTATRSEASFATAELCGFFLEIAGNEAGGGTGRELLVEDITGL